jgi:hypothetical protein
MRRAECVTAALASVIFGTAVLSDDMSIDAVWLRSDSFDADGPTAGPGAGCGPLLPARV